jgi:hypothetical protein
MKLFILAFTLMMCAVVTSRPAEAQQYFKNHCAWDVSSHCAAKRAEAQRAGRPMPKASVSHHGELTKFAPLRP